MKNPRIADSCDPRRLVWYEHYKWGKDLTANTAENAFREYISLIESEYELEGVCLCLYFHLQ